ncbi:hypothetical protein Moror_3795 [Moniliophthora roreri MCA 2997]|uniref:Uncharacterized protein n=1 Tax=Moniliophthora roreri (strain MCA 2997) TaxID=1381753 RepID=V2WUP5_MONRO|nr:hypothetical protein Moror_3795 [Moniliophthora roreri MCA 2997]
MCSESRLRTGSSEASDTEGLLGITESSARPISPILLLGASRQQVFRYVRTARGFKKSVLIRNLKKDDEV